MAKKKRVGMLITLIASVFSFSVLIIVHELGHFVAAKLSRIRVLKFSLGLGPRLLGFKRGDTEWVLSWIPFGGYVKLAGMDPGEIEGREWEFNSKRLWVRGTVVSAGVFFNFLLAVFIFSAVIWLTGVDVIGTTTVGRVEIGSPAFEAGMRRGDEIVSIEGEGVETWTEVVQSIARARGKVVRLSILRGKTREEVFLEPEYEQGQVLIGLDPWLEPVVGGVKTGSPAEELGLRAGDRIVMIGGEEFERKVEQWYDLHEVVSANPGVPLKLVWKRGLETFENNVVPQAARDQSVDGELKTVGRLGVLRRMEKQRFGFFPSFREGFLTGAHLTGDLVALLWRMVRRQVSPRALGGPITIVMLAGESARWGISWLFGLIAVVSVNLMVINCLPIPPFDGAHLVLLSVEGIKRGPISDRQKLVIQQIGIALILLLIIYITRNDLIRWFAR